MTLTFPLVHLRYTSLVLLGSNLGSMMEAVGVVDEPGFRTTEESCTLASSQPKVKEKNNNKFLLRADSVPGNVLCFNIGANQTETFLEVILN